MTSGQYRCVRNAMPANANYRTILNCVASHDILLLHRRGRMALLDCVLPLLILRDEYLITRSASTQPRTSLREKSRGMSQPFPEGGLSVRAASVARSRSATSHLNQQLRNNSSALALVHRAQVPSRKEVSSSSMRLLV